MATEPPDVQLRPPDQDQSTRNSCAYKPLVDASPESSANSSKMRRIEAIHVAISEKELDWARKIISLEQSGMIRVNPADKHESTYKDLSASQKSNDSIIQIERSKQGNSREITQESPSMRPQIRTSSNEINDVSTTGESSPGQGEPPPKNLKDFDGGNSGDIRTATVTGAPINSVDERQHQMAPGNENKHSKVLEPKIQQQYTDVCNSLNLQDPVAITDDAQHMGEAVESVNGTKALNQEANQNKEYIPNRKRELMIQEQDQLITKGTK
ncbi:hypothetical protein RDI58_000913 [Solanum bulbocastanum]|uniref:Uncharacterized protein n=1 Tax=Solanum bulbocastanum TaxID=147425 RepID=A0AAN8YPK7_SOLBU